MCVCVCVRFRKCGNIKNWRYGGHVEGIGTVGCRKLVCAANVTVNEFSCLPTFVSLTEYLCLLDVTKYSVLIVVTRHKGRGEVTCVHAVKHAWVEAQCHSFLITALNGGRWSASCSSHFIPSSERRLFPYNGRLGGPQSESGHFEVEKNLLPLPRFKP